MYVCMYDILMMTHISNHSLECEEIALDSLATPHSPFLCRLLNAAASIGVVRHEPEKVCM